MFEFTFKEHCAGEDVWWYKVRIGSVKLMTRNNPDVDWVALRANRTLRLSYSERFMHTYRATSSLGEQIAGAFSSKEDAGNALLNHHRQLYEKTVVNNKNK